MVKSGFIDGFSEIKTYPISGRRNAFSLLLPPPLRSWILRRRQAPVTKQLAELVERVGADVCILSDRDLLFSMSAMSKKTYAVIDWCDSFALFSWRGLRESIRSRRFQEIRGRLIGLIAWLWVEWYYPRLAHANFVVSSADYKALRRICWGAPDLRIIPNGIDMRTAAKGSPEKIKDRLVFSGRMDFPPNYESALWFLDSVLPIILGKRPTVRFVGVGANPVRALLERQSEVVRFTGMVEDVRTELAMASLYVAPLVSGSGFKNKIFEAIAAGTVVVGTPLASEFTPPELSKVVYTARGAENFAETVLAMLDRADSLEDEVKRARRFLAERFSWRVRAADLESILGFPQTGTSLAQASSESYLGTQS